MDKGFQILNAEGVAIPINKIDREVAEFWGNKCLDNEYAKPLSRDKFPEGIKGSLEYYQQTNWFDKIGWLIKDEWCTWKSLKGDIIACQKDLIAESLFNDDFMELVKLFRELYKPWFDLIDHFKSKGYTPKQVEVY